MLRHTVSIEGSPTIRQAYLSTYLQGVQDGACLKLFQGEHVVYLPYRLTENMQNHV